MVDSLPPTGAAGPTRRRAIPTRTSTSRAAPRAATAGKQRSAKSTATKPAAKPRKARTARARARAAQPLGVGVADAFAVRRLKIPRKPPRKDGVLEIGWAEFGRLANVLAAEMIRADYRPDVVLGVANAGVFVGGALAPVLRADLVHLHLPGRGAEVEALPSLAGKSVLVVDDTADTGRTLAKAVALAKKARAAKVRTAVVVLRPGGARPDFHALASGDLVVFGWDYQFHGGGDGGDPGDTGV
jgi:hypoxanthine phosphoribosyltransferase